jgi:calcineurin-like phosphoesterase family protein
MRSDEFITADTHFSHAQIIQYCKRPFTSVQEMDEQLIRRWNRKVPQRAIVYHLGDFCFATKDRQEKIMKRLNGQIRLVRGNHDKKVRCPELFDWIKDYYESTTESGRKVVMCHYPFATWNGASKGAWMLHGHSHGNYVPPPGKPLLDVGVDTHPNYEPFAFSEIERRLRDVRYTAVDHHGRKSRK